MLEVISEFWSEYGGILLTGTRDTLVMVLISTLFAYLLGLPLGVALTVTQPHGIRPSKPVNQILGWIVNIGRSVPFIILMVAIMTFTEVEAATIPSIASEVDLAVINSNYALGAGLNPVEDALALESSDSPYVNVLVCKEGNENNAAIQALAEALHSDAVKNYIAENFDGAVIAVD